MPPSARFRSLRLRVLALTLGAVVLAWLVAGGIAYVEVRHEADELLDGYLAQTAAILHARIAGDLDETPLEHAPELHRYARRLAFQVWDREGTLRLHSANAPDARLSTRDDGFDDVAIDGRRYRVFASLDPTRRTLVQVGEQRRVRDEIVAAVGQSLATPLAVAVPVLALLVWLAVTAGMRPLASLSREIASRDPANLAPIGVDDLPAELAPVVASLDALLDRLGRSLERERAFTADAAHELRTPIAALRVQAEVARGADDDATRRRAIDRVIEGCDRAARLVDQMLTLARLDPLRASAPDSRCDLADVARDAVAEVAPAALARHVEVALDATPAPVRGDRAWLAILLRNLLDNAVRHARSEVHVRVSHTDDAAAIAVADDGPGVVPDELTQLGRRFHRGSAPAGDGSGLGLSIVAGIAALHRANVAYALRDGGGLVATVTLHAAPPPAAVDR